ncbi:MAG: PAS domain S-box protein, partial [Candidatus Bathyarchaeia archaeon]
MIPKNSSHTSLGNAPKQLTHHHPEGSQTQNGRHKTLLTTEKLRYMQENLRDLMEVAPVVVYMLSSDGKITFLSPKFEEITGWSRKEWLNKSFEALIHPEDLPLAKETFKRVLEGERPPPYELRVLSKSGEYIVGEFTSIPITENGKVIGEFGVVQNITEKKRAESALKEREELFRSIVENSHNAIIIVDENFKITYANNEATVLSGYKKEEIIGQHFRKVLAEEDKSLVEERYILRQKGKQVPPKYEFKIIRKDGEKRDVELRATIIRDKNGKVCTIAQLLDITDRKRFEESLSALHAYGQNLTMAKNMKEIYKLTLDALTKTSTFEYASIFIMEGKNLRLAAHRGYPKSQKLVIPLNDGMEIVTKAARTGESINIPDIRKEKAYAKTRKGILSELAVPIKMGNKILGVLNVESHKLAAFDEEDIKLLEILASHMAIAMSNIKRREGLLTLSKRLEQLMKSSTEIMQIKNMHRRLKAIAKTIQKFGWRRVVISLRDENLEEKDLV